MSKPRRKRRYRVWIIRAALALVAIGGIVVIGGWLAVESIPDWYVPVEVSQAELTRVRNSLPNTYQAINERVMAGAAFDFPITERTVTEWVVARGELYPEARSWLPGWLRDPVVCFRDNRCIIGARVNYQGWQTILGIHLVMDVHDEDLTVRVDKLTAGAVPIPMSQLSEPLADLLDAHRLDEELMPDPIAKVLHRLRERGPEELVEHGVTFPNRIRLRNGNRVVRLRTVAAADGTLTVGLEPMPR